MEKRRFNHELVANLRKEDIEKMSEDEVNIVIDYISPPDAEEASTLQEDSSFLKKAVSYPIKSLLKGREKRYSKQLGFLMQRLEFLQTKDGGI